MGGFGDVWLAQDTKDGHNVAVNIFFTEVDHEEVFLSKALVEADNAKDEEDRDDHEDEVTDAGGSAPF